MGKKNKKKARQMPTTNPFWSKITTGQTVNKNLITPVVQETPNQASQNNLTKNTAEAKSQVMPSSSSAAASVVQGTASNIMLLVQDAKKNVELASTQNMPKKQAKNGSARITRGTLSVEEQIEAMARLANKDGNAQQAPQEIKPSKTTQAPSIQRKNPQEYVHIGMPPYSFLNSYLKGIPRSFYEKPSSQTPEPYSQYALNPQDIPQQTSTQWQQVNAAADVNSMWQPTTPYPTQQLMPDQPLDQSEYPQAYSPSDAYADNLATGSQDGNEDELDLNEDSGSGQKRQSAFDRLGPVSQPKKPKLTINLLVGKEQAIREVVDGTTEEPSEEKKEKPYVPVHLRLEIISSSNPIVVQHLQFWPWKKSVSRIKSVTTRTSKSVMLLEKEQMDELYEKPYMFFVVSVKGYPQTWTKEMLLDTLLENFQKLTPLFIEHTPNECQFFVIRSHMVLLAIHKAGFIVRKDGVELTITISTTTITLKHIPFNPKLILRKILALAYDKERGCMNLSNFTLEEDISHFIYFPLNVSNNQMIIAQEIQSTYEWENITELILSRNRITSIEDFNLVQSIPKLKRLDLSHNYLDKVTALICIRDLGLRSIVLEGNPLCNDYIDSDHYVKVLKTMFPSLKEIDGVPIRLKGDMPAFKKNYCPEAAKPIVDKFLEVYFPLIEAPEEERIGIDKLYHDKASMTITYRFKLRYSNTYRYFRSIFHRSRVMDEGDMDSVDGALEIAKHIEKWPPIIHDSSTFTIDVLYHDDYSTVFKVAGMLKMTTDSLAEDEHLLAFTKAFVLRSHNGYEYKITNEMVYWDVPTAECVENAFQTTTTTLTRKKLSLAFESAPEEELKEGLLKIFMQLTDLDKSASERCLEQKNWNLKAALDYFTKLLKLDDLESLTKELKS